MNRSKLLALAAAAAGLASSAHAAFTPGNLVILTDSAISSSTSAGAITLNEYAYDPATGTFGATPTAHALTGITLPGTADHDGLLRLSTDGSSLTFGGYLAPVGTANVVTSASPRAIGVVDANWNLSTVSLTGYTGVAVRSVVSTDGRHFWTGGDQGTNGGQYYVDASGPSASQVLVNAADSRGNRIDRNQLWTVSSSVGGGSNFGPALPTSATASSLALNSPYVKSDVVFLDLNNDGTSDTAYSTDGKNLLGKWSYNGTSWTLTGSWTGAKTSINDINSLEAFVYNGAVELLAATQSGQLFMFTDANAINAGFGPAFTNTTPTPYLTLTDGSSFRGMAILASVPEPAALTLLAFAPLAFRRRRG